MQRCKLLAVKIRFLTAISSHRSFSCRVDAFKYVLCFSALERILGDARDFTDWKSRYQMETDNCIKSGRRGGGAFGVLFPMLCASMNTNSRCCNTQFDSEGAAREDFQRLIKKRWRKLNDFHIRSDDETMRKADFFNSIKNWARLLALEWKNIDLELFCTHFKLFSVAQHISNIIESPRAAADIRVASEPNPSIFLRSSPYIPI